MCVSAARSSASELSGAVWSDSPAETASAVASLVRRRPGGSAAAPARSDPVRTLRRRFRADASTNENDWGRTPAPAGRKARVTAPELPVVAAARRPSARMPIRSRSIDEPGMSRVEPAASLFGRCAALNSLKRMRVGSATPAPNANTSRVPSEGMNDSKFAAASDTAERIRLWSRSFDSRITNKVEHCEIMVGSISAGRCVTSPRNTPYLRPSLAMRDSARRVGPKPIFLSAGA